MVPRELDGHAEVVSRYEPQLFQTLLTLPSFAIFLLIPIRQQSRRRPFCTPRRTEELARREAADIARCDPATGCGVCEDGAECELGCWVLELLDGGRVEAEGGEEVAEGCVAPAVK